MDGFESQFPELRDGIPYRGVCWRGSRHEDSAFLEFRPSMPGIFFSSDPRYAAGFGKFVHECEIMLENPLIARESRNDSVPSREWLEEAGHDGLIMVFKGDYFVVAMDAGQVRPLRVVPKQDVFGEEMTNDSVPAPAR